MPLTDYLDASRRRFAAVADAGLGLVDAPGLCGVRPLGPAGPDGRLLVADDGALEPLLDLLPRHRFRPVAVLEGAPRCERLLRGDPAWAVQESTAMVRLGLDDLDVPLPAGLTLAPVRRCPEDAPGVDLEEAVRMALANDPEEAAVTTVAQLSAYLRSLPGARLLAAIDGAGRVRATAGSAASDGDCGVFFVNTDQAWRGRGVGTAMTAAALRAARADGARRACLDASAAGLPVYRRLGFEEAARVSRFFPAR